MAESVHMANSEPEWEQEDGVLMVFYVWDDEPVDEDEQMSWLYDDDGTSA